MKKFLKILLWLTVLISVGLFTVFLINVQVGSYAKNIIYQSPAEVPDNSEVAIVLGAKVWSDGSLSHVLLDRVETGVGLYKTGKVKNFS